MRDILNVGTIEISQRSIKTVKEYFVYLDYYTHRETSQEHQSLVQLPNYSVLHLGCHVIYISAIWTLILALKLSNLLFLGIKMSRSIDCCRVIRPNFSNFDRNPILILQPNFTA